MDKFGRDVKRTARKHLQSSPRRMKYKRINASRKLYNSVDFKINGDDMSFWFQDYGVDMDRGVMGNQRKILRFWNKSMFLPRGKGYSNRMPPVRSIKAWINYKSISYSGSIDSAAFAISKNIQQRGKQPTLWFTDAFEQYWDKFDDDMAEAFGKDIEDKLED